MNAFYFTTLFMIRLNVPFVKKTLKPDTTFKKKKYQFNKKTEFFKVFQQEKLKNNYLKRYGYYLLYTLKDLNTIQVLILSSICSTIYISLSFFIAKPFTYRDEFATIVPKTLLPKQILSSNTVKNEITDDRFLYSFSYIPMEVFEDSSLRRVNTLEMNLDNFRRVVPEDDQKKKLEPLKNIDQIKFVNQEKSFNATILKREYKKQQTLLKTVIQLRKWAEEENLLDESIKTNNFFTKPFLSLSEKKETEDFLNEKINQEAEANEENEEEEVVCANEDEILEEIGIPVTDAFYQKVGDQSKVKSSTSQNEILSEIENRLELLNQFRSLFLEPDLLKFYENYYYSHQKDTTNYNLLKKSDAHLFYELEKYLFQYRREEGILTSFYTKEELENLSEFFHEEKPLNQELLEEFSLVDFHEKIFPTFPSPLKENYIELLKKKSKKRKERREVENQIFNKLDLDFFKDDFDRFLGESIKKGEYDRFFQKILEKLQLEDLDPEHQNDFKEIIKEAHEKRRWNKLTEEEKEEEKEEKRRKKEEKENKKEEKENKKEEKENKKEENLKEKKEIKSINKSITDELDALDDFENEEEEEEEEEEVKIFNEKESHYNIFEPLKTRKIYLAKFNEFQKVKNNYLNKSPSTEEAFESVFDLLLENYLKEDEGKEEEKIDSFFNLKNKEELFFEEIKDDDFMFSILQSYFLEKKAKTQINSFPLNSEENIEQFPIKEILFLPQIKKIENLSEDDENLFKNLFPEMYEENSSFLKNSLVLENEIDQDEKDELISNAIGKIETAIYNLQEKKLEYEKPFILQKLKKLKQERNTSFLNKIYKKDINNFFSNFIFSKSLQDFNKIKEKSLQDFNKIKGKPLKNCEKIKGKSFQGFENTKDSISFFELRDLNEMDWSLLQSYEKSIDISIPIDFSFFFDFWKKSEESLIPVDKYITEYFQTDKIELDKQNDKTNYFLLPQNIFIENQKTYFEKEEFLYKIVFNKKTENPYVQVNEIDEKSLSQKYDQDVLEKSEIDSALKLKVLTDALLGKEKKGQTYPPQTVFLDTSFTPYKTIQDFYLNSNVLDIYPFEYLNLSVDALFGFTQTFQKPVPNKIHAFLSTYSFFNCIFLPSTFAVPWFIRFIKTSYNRIFTYAEPRNVARFPFIRSLTNKLSFSVLPVSGMPSNLQNFLKEVQKYVLSYPTRRLVGTVVNSSNLLSLYFKRILMFKFDTPFGGAFVKEPRKKFRFFIFFSYRVVSSLFWVITLPISFFYEIITSLYQSFHFPIRYLPFLVKIANPKFIEFYKRQYLLVGPRGSGKTFLPKVIAGEFKLNIFAMEFRNFVEKNELYAFAKQEKPKNDVEFATQILTDLEISLFDKAAFWRQTLILFEGFDILNRGRFSKEILKDSDEEISSEFVEEDFEGKTYFKRLLQIFRDTSVLKNGNNLMIGTTCSLKHFFDIDKLGCIVYLTLPSFEKRLNILKMYLGDLSIPEFNWTTQGMFLSNLLERELPSYIHMVASNARILLINEDTTFREKLFNENVETKKRILFLQESSFIFPKNKTFEKMTLLFNLFHTWKINWFEYGYGSQNETVGFTNFVHPVELAMYRTKYLNLLSFNNEVQVNDKTYIYDKKKTNKEAKLLPDEYYDTISNKYKKTSILVKDIQV
jgi:hypothetical protein